MCWRGVGVLHRIAVGFVRSACSVAAVDLRVAIGCSSNRMKSSLKRFVTHHRPIAASSGPRAPFGKTGSLPTGSDVGMTNTASEADIKPHDWASSNARLGRYELIIWAVRSPPPSRYVQANVM